MRVHKTEATICQLSLKFKGIVREKLTREKKFTGKIVFEVNCNNGGIGGMKVFDQREIKK
jgi:hypothetical protein